MPKTINTPRDELICGKIDEALAIARKWLDIKLIHILEDIRCDAERMEQKLISRKEEVLALKEGISSERWKNWQETFNS